MRAMYKCRLCGEKYPNGTHAGREIALRCMIAQDAGVQGVVPMAPSMTETHTCGGDHAGSLGVADFLGFEEE